MLSYGDYTIRILIAVLAGGIIGLEREKKKKPAGFITHMLVCVGACIIAVIQVETVDKTLELIQRFPGRNLEQVMKADLGRLTAQVVSGVGFLGAGTIMRGERGTVSGITTAATLWIVACLGLAIGYGLYKVTLVAVILIEFIIIILGRIEILYINQRRIRKIVITHLISEETENDIMNLFRSKDINTLRKKQLSEVHNGENFEKKVLYSITVPRYISTKKLVKELLKYEDINQVIRYTK